MTGAATLSLYKNLGMRPPRPETTTIKLSQIKGLNTNDKGLLEVQFEHLLGVDQKICEFLLTGGTPYCWQIGR